MPGLKKTKVGIVVSDRMQKTVAVLVERVIKHRVFQKYVRVRKKMLVHDDEGAAKVGDKVEIMEARPISRRKRWRLVKVIQKGVEAPAISES